ncbi:MAG TPA: DUF4097 family beta strand repeat-containing protein [Vicinamibacterales bacterium]|nr:DUF4097 family beta strand repeat-containing protein [Vicinamibacterales bacterium]
MKLTRYALAAATVLAVTATPALAQVDVRVKVDTKAVKEAAQDVAREVRQAIQSAMGPEFRRDLEGAIREMAEAFEEFGNRPWGADDRAQSRRFPATQTDRETRRFNVGATGELNLETLSGDVTVRRGSGRDLVVEIVREARGTTDAAVRAGLDAIKAVSEERGGRVTIKSIYPNQRGRSEYSVSVNYIVSAPAGTRISTKSISGDVLIEGIDGEVSVNSTSGDVKITGANRVGSLATISGDVILTNVGAEGLLEASTVSGEIMATGLKARRVSLGTISGAVVARNIDSDNVKLTSMSDDVTFDGTLTPRGRYEFSTHSGDVHIMLDGRTGFSFEGSAFSGNVTSALALQGSRSDTRTGGGRRTGSNRNLNGTFGDGSAIITATSFSGSVIVTKK